MTAINYVAVALVAALIPMAAVVATNVIVDPYDELGNRDWVPAPLVPVERSEKLRMFEALPGRPQTIVFGSSRMMEIDPSLIEPSGFNMAVNSALPEDFLAQVLWLSERNALPRAVVIGLDFDVFNPSIATDARLLSTRFLYQTIADIPEVRELASAEDGGRLISSFWRRYLSRRMFADSRRTIEANIKRLPRRSDYLLNGLLVRRVDLEKRTREGWNAAVTADVLRPYVKEKFDGYDRLSPARILVLERTLRHLANHGVRLTLILTTYHPTVLERIRADPVLNTRLSEVQALLQALSRKYHGKFVDVSDIASIPCNSAEMWDVVHLMPECAQRLASGLRASHRVH